MAVQAGPTEKRYVANGVSKTYTVPFLLLSADDLTVILNGVEQTSGFTFSGVGNATSSITFTTAPVGDLYLFLDITLERLNDYQNNGDFLSVTVNKDFDRIWQALKQQNRGQSRALVLGQNDVDGAGNYQAKGNAIVNLRDPVNPQDAATFNWTRSYLASVIAATTGSINNASNIFYLGPDGFAYVAQDLSSATVPTKGAALIGYKGRTVAARLNDFPSVKDYGCKGDGVTNDRANFQAALYANAGGVLYVPPGVYMVDSTLFIPSNTKLCGAGSTSRIKATAGFTQLNVVWAGGTLPILLANEGILTSAAATRIEISDVFCDSSLTSNGVHNVHMRNTTFCDVTHCTFGGGADGTAFTMSSNYRVAHNFAFGQMNCCYDQWENSTRGLIEGNVGFLTKGYGMLATGDTSLNTVGQTTNISFINNILIGAGTSDASIGLWLQSGSNLTSQCYSCRAEGNYFSGFRVGLRATGGGQHNLGFNRIDNCPEQGLSFSAEVVGNPTSNNAVGGNVLNNSGNVAGGGAIVLNSGARLNTFFGNIASAVTSDYTVVLDATTEDNNFMGGNIFSSGNLGYLRDLGVRNLCANVSSGFYDEGAFIPTLSSSAGGVPTYAAQYGNYQIIGKYCEGSGRLAINSLGSLAAGQIQITGLPKVASSMSVHNQPPVVASFNNCAAAINLPPNGRIPSGTSRIDLSKFSAGSNANLVLADITATLEVTFWFRYRTA